MVNVHWKDGIFEKNIFAKDNVATPNLSGRFMDVHFRFEKKKRQTLKSFSINATHSKVMWNFFKSINFPSKYDFSRFSPQRNSAKVLQQQNHHRMISFRWKISWPISLHFSHSISNAGGGPKMRISVDYRFQSSSTRCNCFVIKKFFIQLVNANFSLWPRNEKKNKIIYTWIILIDPLTMAKTIDKNISNIC